MRSKEDSITRILIDSSQGHSGNTGKDVDMTILASRLEAEFQSALEEVKTLKAFNKEIYRLLQLLGFSGYTFLHWMPGGHYHRQPPKPLIASFPQQAVNRAVNYLVDTAAGQSNTDLLNIYYQESDSLLDRPGSSVRRGCYTLTTKHGNYAYLIRKCGLSPSCQQVLCVFERRKNPDQFKLHIEHNLLALDAISKVIETVGQKQFSDLFAVIESEERNNIGSKPLRLISMIATNDLTIGQASDRLSISVDTANKQIAKVKSELAVSTLPAAVFYAANKGYIDRII